MGYSHCRQPFCGSRRPLSISDRCLTVQDSEANRAKFGPWLDPLDPNDEIGNYWIKPNPAYWSTDPTGERWAKIGATFFGLDCNGLMLVRSVNTEVVLGILISSQSVAETVRKITSLIDLTSETYDWAITIDVSQSLADHNGDLNPQSVFSVSAAPTAFRQDFCVLCCFCKGTLRFAPA
ncbi:hypothetical protein HYZ64_00505, partial [Candidatus Berkelbacteria bacterium]|nr:hypothetical protein [Candidatus Berkelbacteria bacterium]